MTDVTALGIALLFCAATAAGFVDAVAGGGGLITLPAFLAAGVDPVAALATNKVQSTFGAASATWNFSRSGRIDYRLLRWPLMAAAAGAAAGATAVGFIDTGLLVALLPVLLFAIAVYFLIAPQAAEEDARARLGVAAYAGIAAAIGFYDGFFGPGTGSFLALSLVTLLGMGLTRATAHTKALNFATNFVALIVFAANGHALWGLGLFMASGGAVGAWLGSHAAMRFGPRLIRPLLVTVCLAMVARLLADPAHPLRAGVEARIGAWERAHDDIGASR